MAHVSQIIMFTFPAAIRMTVDGGTKQWDKFLGGLPDELKKNIKDPDLISGDFDSITDEILEKYRNKGCKVKVHFYFYYSILLKVFGNINLVIFLLSLDYPHSRSKLH